MERKSWVSTFIFASIAVSIPVQVMALSPEWYSINIHNPYVGFDVQERRMAFKEGFGDNLLHRTSPQGNIYAGILLNEHVGVEAGYEATRTRSRTATLVAGELSGGVPIPVGMSPATFRSNIKIQGPHLGLVAYLPICEICCPFEWYGYIGAARFKATAERSTLAFGPAGTPGLTRKLSARKTIVRAALGIQYKWTERVSLRGTVAWAGTRRIIIHANDTLNNPPEFKPMVSVAYGLGALWNF